MRAFVQKPKTTQQTTSAKSTIPDRTHLGQSHKVNSILSLQRAIWNQPVQRLLEASSEDVRGDDSSTTEFARFAHDFSRISIFSPSPVQTQPKRTVSTPGDTYEQEADLIADRVMRMPKPDSESIQLMRDKRAQRLCSACEEKSQRQPNSGGLTTQPTPIGQAGLDSLGSGSALPTATRQFFEPRFGYSFENVHVRTDTKAAHSAAALQAKVYTLGNHIVFGENEYQPATAQGQHLLAHELTHVMQQNAGMTGPVIQRLSDPDCSSASPLPFSDSCASYNNTCNSRSFTAPGGTVVTISVTVNYDNPTDCSFPEGREDFRVRLMQCGWFDSEVKNFGTSTIGTTLTDTATLPGAGIIQGNDNYYLKVFSRSNCKLTTSMNVR